MGRDLGACCALLAVRLSSRPSPGCCASAADALPRKGSGRAFLSGSSQLTGLTFLLGVDKWLPPVSTSGIGVLELESLFSSFLTQSLASPIPPLQVTVALAQLQAFTPSALQHTLTVKPLYICKVKKMHT